MVDVPLTDEIKALGISKVEITSDQLTVYNGNASVRSRFYKSDLERTLQETSRKNDIFRSLDDQQAVEKIIVLLSSSYVNHEEKQSEENKKQKSASYAQVYKLPGLMAEAIMVGQTPLWLVTEGPGRIEVVERIDISETEYSNRYLGLDTSIDRMSSKPLRRLTINQYRCDRDPR